METSDFLVDDPFKHFAEPEQEQYDYEGGLKCELKTYEARFNSKGERVVLNAGMRKVLEPPPHRDFDSALALTKFYDKEKQLEYTELNIRSPHIKTALRTVIPQYPGMNLKTQKIVIRDLPKCLFHYRKELQAYGNTLQDPVAVQHLVFALQYMFKTLQSEMYSYYNFMESNSIAPGLDFLNLWMAFRPGEFVYTKSGDVERVLRFDSMSRCNCLIPWCSNSKWTIKADYIDYDGTDFGLDYQVFFIRPYNDYKALKDLKIYPLEYHPNKDAIVEAMVTRGKKFVALHGKHHREYDGIVEALSSTRRSSLLGEEDEFPLQSTQIKGRIMVDGGTFASARPSHRPYLRTESRMIRTETEDHLRLSDDDLLICHYAMPGFSLLEKKWCFFVVDKIKDIEYNSDAFESLLLPAEQKRMIHSLVKIHTDERLRFDDVIKGKGRGMIFLLHGAPGIGKTLTAESVADVAQRPLYPVTAGDLGVEAASVEQNLTEALQLATKWNAVVLIDEADVFLEQRGAHDLERNSLVSVFLRVLEYYEGVMILTTNRIGSFDAAFKSRIHLAIKYHPLSQTSRSDLWRTFLSKAITPPGPGWIRDGSIDTIATHELNGRQIKNVVRTAHALAVSEGLDLNLVHINMALNAMEKFETDFTEDKAKHLAELDTTQTEERTSKKRRLG